MASKSKSCGDLMPVTFRCEVCGSEKLVTPSFAGRIRTCSRKCFRTLAGAGKHESRICKRCGASFRAYIARETKFCSMACSRASRRVPGAKWRDPKQIAAYQREYQKKNRRRISDLALAWSERNREKRRGIASAYQHRKRALEAGNVSLRESVKSRPKSATPEAVRAVFGKANKHCVYCGKHSRELTTDHYVPISKGGLHVVSNLVPCCRQCNSSKGARDPEEWIEERWGITGIARAHVFLRRGKFDNVAFAALLGWGRDE